MQGHKMEHKRERWLATIESVECELYKWTIYSEQHRRNIQDLLDKIKIELISLSKISPIVEAEFVKKRYTIHGSAEIETSDGITRIIFSDDFKTKNGPDLKVYLSKIPLTELSEKDVDDDALRVSVLKSHKGSQSYTLPANIVISEYKSVVIQCEAYAVLWGGFDL